MAALSGILFIRGADDGAAKLATPQRSTATSNSSLSPAIPRSELGPPNDTFCQILAMLELTVAKASMHPRRS